MKYALKSGARPGTGIVARLLAVAAMACCCAAHGVDNGNRPVRGGDWKVALDGDGAVSALEGSYIRSKGVMLIVQ